MLLHQTAQITQSGCGDPDIWEPNWLGTICPGEPNIGDHLTMGTEIVGDFLSKRINFMGIVCLGGQEFGVRKPRDQMDSGPNASQPTDHPLVDGGQPLGTISLDRTVDKNKDAPFKILSPHCTVQ